MNALISRDSLWGVIKTLSYSNRKWLSQRLTESLKAEKQITKEELSDGIRKGLVQSLKARAEKRQLKTLQEVIDEL